ncbi:hypothetical protein [Streptomyces sp. NPDC060194]|uniref:hypothetical protein n=1 Tax=Streptomyces sp. NPDC060194 TaxID=3347069 RepID=UPI00364722FC
MSAAPNPAPEGRVETPVRLAVAAAVCAAEGLALAGWGVYLLVMGLVGDPDSPRQAETGGLTMIALAVLPLVAARGLRLRRSWSRGPTLIMQLVALPVSWSLVQGGGVLLPVGILLALAAVAVLVTVLNPTTTHALGIGRRET